MICAVHPGADAADLTVRHGSLASEFVAPHCDNTKLRHESHHTAGLVTSGPSPLGLMAIPRLWRRHIRWDKRFLSSAKPRPGKFTRLVARRSCKPARRAVVTHVWGTFCYLCVRAGQMAILAERETAISI